MLKVACDISDIGLLARFESFTFRPSCCPAVASASGTNTVG